MTKELNKTITRYARAVATSETRLRLELELMKQAATQDILDREATYTSTLETIRSMEPKESGCAHSGFSDGTVVRAMQVVAAINTTMGGVTAAVEPFYGDASKCNELLSK
jgi:hypothetical protein